MMTTMTEPDASEVMERAMLGLLMHFDEASAANIKQRDKVVVALLDMGVEAKTIGFALNKTTDAIYKIRQRVEARGDKDA